MAKRSPLKAKPLRNPGESTERTIQEMLLDVVSYIAVAVAFAMVAFLEWWRFITDHPPAPVTWTVIAAAFSCVAIWAIWRARIKARSYRLGLEGEKAVGQYLEHLRKHGAHVYHDIPGDGFNLDHVIIHDSGIYVIETKTVSKPEQGRAEALFDGERVILNGAIPSRNPIAQVRAARDWLVSLLKESAGRVFPIRSVVLYPGWWIQPTAEAKASDVWVLNPKALPAFISNSNMQLKPDEVTLCSFHLSRYIRAKES